MKAPCKGFTLIEVLACLLILALGIGSATGLILYGLRLAKINRGKTLGAATVNSVVVDPSPLKTDSLWSTSNSGGRSTTTGFLNGLYIVRTEVSEDVVVNGPAGFIAATVHVDAYEVQNGTPVASTTRRMLVKKAP